MPRAQRFSSADPGSADSLRSPVSTPPSSRLQDRPEELRPQLEELLASLGCAYAYSTVSKFGTFRAGALPPQPA